MTKVNKIEPKYSFDEIVKIIHSKYSNDTVLNNIGYISGMAKDDSGLWGYGVYLFNIEEVWYFDEEDLAPTGKFVPNDFNMSGESIKIIVDPKTSKGLIKVK